MFCLRKVFIYSIFTSSIIIALFIESCSYKELDKAVLGKLLFYDTQLSLNNTKSCASCHSPTLAFTDGYRTSTTPFGENLDHNAPTLLNSSNMKFLDWANPNIKTLEQQIKRPLYSKHPAEMRLDAHWASFLIYLKSNNQYSKVFNNIDTVLITPLLIEQSIVAFVRTLQSKNAAYDKYIAGNTMALSKSAVRGMKLFNSQELKCSTCHPAPSFSLATLTENSKEVFRNIGLEQVVDTGAVNKANWGIYEYNNNLLDYGRFRIPSLRNVAITAPYMHSGQLASIKDVIEHYKTGGAHLKNKDSLITGFSLNEDDELDLIAFLNSLTDTSYNNIYN